MNLKEISKLRPHHILRLNGEQANAAFTIQDWRYDSRTHRIYRNPRIGGKKVWIPLASFLLQTKGQVDHINSDTWDNRLENLRECSQRNNAKNRSKGLGTTSKYKGVTYVKSRGKWQATIMNNYRSVFIGRFDSEIDAALAYNVRAKELHGEFAKLNEI